MTSGSIGSIPTSAAPSYSMLPLTGGSKNRAQGGIDEKDDIDPEKEICNAKNSETQNKKGAITSNANQIRTPSKIFL